MATAARVGVVLALHDQPLLQPRPGLDSGVYLDLARRVAGGDLLCGNQVFFVSPFYVYFAGAVLALAGGSVLVLQLVQALLGVAAVWLVAEAARIWFGRRGAWIAATLASVTGVFAFQESLLLQSAVDPFLTALGLWALARAWTEPRWQRFLVAGVVLGLHTLNRPNMVVWAAASVILTVVHWVHGVHEPAAEPTATPKRGGYSVKPTAGPKPTATPKRGGYTATALAQGLSPAFPLIAGLLLAFLPVAARNSAVAGQFAVLPSHGGLNFYIGNNPRADGTYRLVPGITPSIEGQASDMRRVAGEATGRPMTDTEASAWFYAQAMKWLGERPLAAASLTARKLALALNAVDIPLNDSYAYFATDEASPLRVLVVGPWLLLPLGLAGIWLGGQYVRMKADVRTAMRAWWSWVSFIPVYALAVAVFFVTGRYRLPILVACCVTSAASVLALIDSLYRRPEGRRLHLSLAGGRQPEDLGPHLGPDGRQPGERRLRVGGWRHLAAPLAALAALGIGVNIDLGIDNGLAGSRGEMILYDIANGNVDAAEARLARAEPMYPNRPLLLYRVGRAYREHGDRARALVVLDRARALAPDRKEIDGEIGETLLDMAKAGQRDAALAALRALRSPETLDAGTQAALGQMALELGDAALAENLLARSVQALPGSARLREAHGLALAELRRVPEATAALEDAVRLDPSNPGVRMNLAVLYAQAGRFNEARQAAAEAVRLRPDDPRPREFLASLPIGR